MTRVEQQQESHDLKIAGRWDDLALHYEGRGHSPDAAAALVESARVRQAQREAQTAKYNMEMDQLVALSESEITPAVVAEFYRVWKTCTGYMNPLIGVRHVMSKLKIRIIKHMLDLARRKRWQVWRQCDVLYIETPHGQCSWHINPRNYAHRRIRKDLKWSGVRNSDRVICACVGPQDDKTRGRCDDRAVSR